MLAMGIVNNTETPKLFKHAIRLFNYNIMLKIKLIKNCDC